LGLINLDLRILRALRLLRLLKLLRDIIPAIRSFRRANAGRTPRQKVYALMNETPTSGRLHEQIDFIFVFFIITSVFAVFLETVPSIYDPLKDEFHYFDLLTIVFLPSSTFCVCMPRLKVVQNTRKLKPADGHGRNDQVHSLI